jgi:DNA-directed RNA polymerase specialized sigma24 family protein
MPDEQSLCLEHTMTVRTRQSSGLSGWLRLLAGHEAKPHERNAAVSQLLAGVRLWAPAYLRRVAASNLNDADVEDVIQHLLCQSSVGSSRFNGKSEGEAFVWCTTVMRNKARDICRNRKKYAPRPKAVAGGDGNDPRLEQPVDPDLTSLVASELVRMLETIEAELLRLHRLGSVSGVLRSVRCHLEHRLGATMEEQLERYGYGATEKRTPANATKARQRVYQYRQRGRRAACEALAALVSQARVSQDDVDAARALLDC